jgi:hypothetical protein
MEESQDQTNTENDWDTQIIAESRDGEETQQSSSIYNNTYAVFNVDRISSLLFPLSHARMPLRRRNANSACEADVKSCQWRKSHNNIPKLSYCTKLFAIQSFEPRNFQNDKEGCRE